MSGGDARPWPFGARAAVGAVPLGLARLGLADAGRAGARRPTRSATGRLAAHGRPRLVHVRPVAADLRRPRQRPAADPHRRRADRLRRRLAGAVAARHRRRRGGRPARRRGRRPGSSAPTRRRRPTYDPATGVTFDGVAPDGTRQPQLRRRVHHPRAARRCSRSTRTRRPGAIAADRHRPRPGRHRRSSQAEDATLAGGAQRRARRRRCGPASRSTAAPATPSLRDGSTATFDARRAPGARC